MYANKNLPMLWVETDVPKWSKFLKKVTAADETWVHPFHPFTNYATIVLKDWFSLYYKRQQAKSVRKVMMNIFFDKICAMHRHAVPTKTIVNGVLCINGILYYVSIYNFFRQRKHHELYKKTFRKRLHYLFWKVI